MCVCVKRHFFFWNGVALHTHTHTRELKKNEETCPQMTAATAAAPLDSEALRKMRHSKPLSIEAKET